MALGGAFDTLFGQACVFVGGIDFFDSLSWKLSAWSLFWLSLDQAILLYSSSRQSNIFFVFRNFLSRFGSFSNRSSKLNLKSFSFKWSYLFTNCLLYSFKPIFTICLCCLRTRLYSPVVSPLVQTSLKPRSSSLNSKAGSEIFRNRGLKELSIFGLGGISLVHSFLLCTQSINFLYSLTRFANVDFEIYIPELLSLNTSETVLLVELDLRMPLPLLETFLPAESWKAFAIFFNWLLLQQADFGSQYLCSAVSACISIGAFIVFRIRISPPSLMLLTNSFLRSLSDLKVDWFIVGIFW